MQASSLYVVVTSGFTFLASRGPWSSLEQTLSWYIGHAVHHGPAPATLSATSYRYRV